MNAICFLTLVPGAAEEKFLSPNIGGKARQWASKIIEHPESNHLRTDPFQWINIGGEAGSGAELEEDYGEDALETAKDRDGT